MHSHLKLIWIKLVYQIWGYIFSFTLLAPTPTTKYSSLETKKLFPAVSLGDVWDLSSTDLVVVKPKRWIWNLSSLLSYNNVVMSLLKLDCKQSNTMSWCEKSHLFSFWTSSVGSCKWMLLSSPFALNQLSWKRFNVCFILFFFPKRKEEWICACLKANSFLIKTCTLCSDPTTPAIVLWVLG